ncbi:hypothetical protein ACXR0O_18075 [Verrucomicrobiota bacterium sgz303538]
MISDPDEKRPNTSWLALLLGALTAFGPLAILCLSSLGMAGPNLMTAALAPFQKSAGSASALLGLAQYAVGGIAGVLVGVLHNGTAVPMTAIVALCGVGSLLALYTLTNPSGAIG